MPRIIGGSLEEHRERMHERIFSSFSILLDERGYDAVTLADVASHAGIGRTAMYNYYPDKESLLIALMAHETGRYVERLLQEIATVSNPLDKLRVYVRMQLNQLAQQHFAPVTLSKVMTVTGHQKVLEHVAPLRGTLRSIIKGAIDQRYLPDEDLDVLLPLVTATIAGRSTADLHGQELEHAIDATTLFVLRGLGARIGADGRPRRLTAAPPATARRGIASA